MKAGLWLMCPPSDTADTPVSLISRSCLHVSISHLFSCDKDIIISLPELGKTLVPLEKKKNLPQICHDAMKNNCDFLPVWRDWPVEEWVFGGDRACVSLHVLSWQFACYLIRALQANWKIDLVMLPYSTSVCAALSRMMTRTCSLCKFFLLSCCTCKNQETTATFSPCFYYIL